MVTPLNIVWTRTVVFTLLLVFPRVAYSKPAAKAEPCLECLEQGEENHKAAHDDVIDDVKEDVNARNDAPANDPGDAEKLMHGDDSADAHDKIADKDEHSDQDQDENVGEGLGGGREEGGVLADDLEKEGHGDPLDTAGEAQPANNEGRQDFVDHIDLPGENVIDAVDHGEVQNVMAENLQPDPALDDPRLGDNNKYKKDDDDDIDIDDDDDDDDADDAKPVVPDPQSLQFQGGDVAEMLHGDSNVHDPSHRPAAEDEEGVPGVGGQVGAGNVEKMLHGDSNVHDPSHHSQAADEEDGVPGGGEQVGAGDVEKMLHGDSNVHDPSHHRPQAAEEDEEVPAVGEQLGAGDVEHLTHAEKDGHASANQDKAPDDSFTPPVQAGDVEEMVHGEGHVHDAKDKDHAPLAEDGEKDPLKAYGVGDDPDSLGLFNVHDPSARDKVVASAGDLSEFMGGGGGGGGGGGEKEPTVVDPEHLMHGNGGHDHDVKQLKFLPTKEDQRARDAFENVHELVMHHARGEHEGEGGESVEDEDRKIRRGKTITYKDILELGLDEEKLKGIDLKKLLLENAQEYDDWQRSKDFVSGENPEASFWEQVGELRRRYLTFGRNDGEAKDLTGTRLDPAQQRWEGREGAEARDPALHDAEHLGQGEDSVLHDLEVLGNTASRQERHKHPRKHGDDDHHDGDNIHNGRDVADL